MKKTAVGVVGIILAAILLCLGILTKVPPKEISFFQSDGNGYEEYVGGDAYNIQIEASLRSGEIAGGKAARAIYFAGAAILLVLSLAMFVKKEELGHQRLGIPLQAVPYAAGQANVSAPVLPTEPQGDGRLE